METYAFKAITKMSVSLTRLNILKLKYSDKFKRYSTRYGCDFLQTLQKYA